MNFQPQNTRSYPLQSIYFYPTESCNLRCVHCWIHPAHAADKKAYADQNKNNVSVDIMEQVVRDALPLGLGHIKFTGGEPFLNTDLFEYLKRFSSFGLSFSIETNGTLITKIGSKKLGRYHLRQVSTSLDGSTPAMHDSIRGVKGSFEKALRGIRLLIENNIYPQVIFCLQQANASDLEDTIQLAYKLGVKSFEINPLSLLGNGTAGSKKCRSLPVEELLELEKKIEGPMTTSYAGMNIDLYLPPALKGIRELSRQTLCSCNILNICGILSNGDVSICGIGRLDQNLVLGNIKEKSIAHIWENAPLFNEIRQRVPFDLEGVCGKCLFKYQCLGFCRADVLGDKHSLVDPNCICNEVYQKGLFPKTRILEAEADLVSGNTGKME
jgi:SynChlorMet cassette radical SAM/SPASM protein ScmF